MQKIPLLQSWHLISRWSLSQSRVCKSHPLLISVRDPIAIYPSQFMIVHHTICQSIHRRIYRDIEINVEINSILGYGLAITYVILQMYNSYTPKRARTTTSENSLFGSRDLLGIAFKLHNVWEILSK